MALQGAIDTAGSPALQGKAGDWLLMPGERLVWVGQPAVWDRAALRNLSRQLLGWAGFAAAGMAIALVLGFLWWRFWMWANSDDVLPLSEALGNVAEVVGGLAVLSAAILAASWVSEQRRRSRTRYAITDRRVIKLCRRRGGTEIRCLSSAAAGPGALPDQDGNIVVGEPQTAVVAAVGSLVAPESLTLLALGPARAAALAALLSQRERRRDEANGEDAPSRPALWEGGAAHGAVLASKLLGWVSGLLFVLGFFQVGVEVLGGSAALFGYPMAPTPEGSEDTSAIWTFPTGAIWLFLAAASLLANVFERQSDKRLRQLRSFQIADGRASVVPKPPFGGAASCPISPDMRIDLWLGRRPHVHFVGRVDEREGSKSLTRVGFDAPADPMGAYMALVAARDVAARAQSGPTGGT